MVFLMVLLIILKVKALVNKAYKAKCDSRPRAIFTSEDVRRSPKSLNSLGIGAFLCP